MSKHRPVRADSEKQGGDMPEIGFPLIQEEIDEFKVIAGEEYDAELTNFTHL